MDLGTAAKVLAILIFGLLAMHVVLSRCRGCEHTVRHVDKPRWLNEVFGECGRML